MVHIVIATGQILGWQKLRSYQQESAEKLVSGQARGLWMSTGTGKTAVLLSAWGLLGAPHPALFLSKAIGRHVFDRDARWSLGADFAPGVLWSGSTHGTGIHKTPMARGRSYTSLDKALSENLGVAMNYELLGPRMDELTKVPWKALILDEAHEIRGGYRPAKKRDGKVHYLRYHHAKCLAELVRSYGGVVWSATATPVINLRRDLFAQLDIVCPREFGSSYSFLQRYCNAFINEWGGLNTSGTSHSEELHAKIQDRFVVLRRADVEDQMPSIQRDLLTVEIGQSSISFKHMGGGLETAIDRASEMKIPATLDLAAEYLMGGLKIVVVTTRRRLAHTLAFQLTGRELLSRLPTRIQEALDVQCITGEIEAKKRIGIIETFNQREQGPAVLVATMTSIRESVDLHHTDGVIVTALPFDFGTVLQFEGRFSRLGGRPTTIHYLIASGTIDEAIREVLLTKLDDAERLGAETQGSSGVQTTLSGQVNEEAILAQLRGFLARLDGEPESEAA